MDISLSEANLFLALLVTISAENLAMKKFDCGISAQPKLIINGSAAAEGQFPWMVNLKIYPVPGVEPSRCGGTILNRRHVLTAAHCVILDGKKAFAIDVLYGNNNVSKATKIAVEKMIAHSLYKGHLSSNDIAILLVKKPFQYSNHVGPVCLPTRKIDVLGKLVVASGWGFAKSDGRWVDYLQYTTFTVVPNRVCQSLHRTSHTEGTVLCAQNNGTSVCHGDSGGPISTRLQNGRFVQVGITSYGFSSCASFAAVFTRIDAFMPWITKYTGNHTFIAEKGKNKTAYRIAGAPAIFSIISPSVFEVGRFYSTCLAPMGLPSPKARMHLSIMVNAFRASLLVAACHMLSAQDVQLNEKDCGQTSEHLIVNGTFAKKTQIPWMVFLQLYFPTFQSRCGGSIITRRHVLTAAHCTIWLGKEVVRIDVIYGDSDIHRGNKLRVVKIRRHACYDADKWTNDIAILLVDKPFHYCNNARPICVPLAPVNFFNKHAVVAGWGRIVEYGASTDRLVYTVLKILPNDVCAKIYQYFSYRPDINYCAYGNSTDSCEGDSGGPLFTKAEGGHHVQAGIVSYGMGCGGAPGVYTRVDAYADWIQAAVRSNEGYRDLVVEDAEQPLIYQIFQWSSFVQAPPRYVLMWRSLE